MITLNPAAWVTVALVAFVLVLWLAKRHPRGGPR
jgi:hypothetical protein